MVSEYFSILFFYFGKFFVLFLFFMSFFYLFLFLIFYDSFFHSLAGTWFWLIESGSAKNVQKMPLKVYIIVTFSLANICSKPEKSGKEHADNIELFLGFFMVLEA